LIGDKAYDSDGLDRRLLRERKTEMIAPHKGGRKKPRTQDGRKLRRYKRRWKSSVSSRGCKTLGGWWSDMNTMVMQPFMLTAYNDEAVSSSHRGNS